MRLKDEKPGALPAVVILIVLGATLVFFDLAERTDNPTITAGPNTSTETTSIIPRTSEDILREQLDEVVSSTQKIPFRATVVTENGVAGVWSQDGMNYRFEDAAKTKIIIVNAAQEKLWVIDVHAKIAHESPFDVSNVGAFNALMPTLFLEGLSTSTASSTQSLLDVLPSGEGAKLTFTPENLPDRWESKNSDGSRRFIDWEYVRLGALAPTDFELWKGLTVSQTTPAQPTTTIK